MTRPTTLHATIVRVVLLLHLLVVRCGGQTFGVNLVKGGTANSSALNSWSTSGHCLVESSMFTTNDVFLVDNYDCTMWEFIDVTAARDFLLTTGRRHVAIAMTGVLIGNEPSNLTVQQLDCSGGAVVLESRIVPLTDNIMRPYTLSVQMQRGVCRLKVIYYCQNHHHDNAKPYGNQFTIVLMATTDTVSTSPMHTISATASPSHSADASTPSASGTVGMPTRSTTGSFTTIASHTTSVASTSLIASATGSTMAATRSATQWATKHSLTETMSPSRSRTPTSSKNMTLNPSVSMSSSRSLATATHSKSRSGWAPKLAPPMLQAVAAATETLQWTTAVGGPGSGTAVGRVGAVRSIALCGNKNDDNHGPSGGGLLGVAMDVADPACTGDNSRASARGAVVGNGGIIVCGMALIGLSTAAYAARRGGALTVETLRMASLRLGVPSVLIPVWIAALPSTAAGSVELLVRSNTDCVADICLGLLGSLLCVAPVAWISYVLFCSCRGCACSRSIEPPNETHLPTVVIACFAQAYSWPCATRLHGMLSGLLSQSVRAMLR